MVSSQASRGKEMRKIEIDHQVLEDCAKRGLSQLEMAVELNTSQAVVNARLREYGLKSRGGRKSACDLEQLKKLLLQGRTSKEIAEFLHVAPSTVGLWIKNNNLQGHKTAIPKKRCNTCRYREASKTAGNCDYLRKVGHSRGCPVLGCTEYVKDDHQSKRKRSKKKDEKVNS